MTYETEFKQELATKLQDKDVSETSIKLYLRNLEKLNDDQPLKNIKFLKDYDNIIESLNDYKPNTQRNYIIAINSVLSLDPSKNKKLRQQYFDLMMNMNKVLKEKESENKQSQTQKENWITQDEVKARLDELRSKVDKFKKNKTLTESQYNTLLQTVILSLYVLHPARRNKDYQLMNIVKREKQLADNLNYLDLDNNKFIFNKFKTSKTEGSQEIPIEPELMEIIKIYLKYHPGIDNNKKFNVPFLVTSNGEPLKNINAITLILNRIFKKKIGSSALRGIYLTSKYGNVRNDMKEDAQKMAHSIETQQNTYVKTDI